MSEEVKKAGRWNIYTDDFTYGSQVHDDVALIVDDPLASDDWLTTDTGEILST